LELAAERLEVTVDGPHAHTVLHQTWRNPTSGAVEGTYRLAAGADARATGFSYWNGEQRIVGEVFEKQAAEQVYRDVTGLERDPGLLVEDHAGTFSFRVFPIAAEEAKRVEVAWDRWLARSGTTCELRVGLEHAAPSATIQFAREPASVPVSDTHELRWDATRRRAVIGAPKSRGGELVVRWSADLPPMTLGGAVHRDPGQPGYAVVRLAAPEHTDRAAPKDVTLVLDRSGSMSGEPLAQAKAAARAVLARLAPEDRVNVVAFDDTVDPLWSRPRRLTPELRREAELWVDGLTDGGGTNLQQALEKALAAQLHDELPDVVVFLTDGQSDGRATLAAAAADPGSARVFTVGLGEGVDRALLARLAAQKRGRFAHVPRPEGLVAAVDVLLRRIEAPVVVDLELDGGGRLERVYPKVLPDLFAGDELRIAARVRGDAPLDLTLRGRRDGKPVTFRAQLPGTAGVGSQSTRPWVGRTWGTARVDDLLEEIAIHGETEELKSEVLDLSLAYELAGPYTAFLAIPEGEATGAAADALASARDRKQAILAAHPDAAALSRAAMPPGDPVLRVKAPRNARQVTARFPFGLVRDLEWDPRTETWTTRFLVPKAVRDGTYEVEVVVVQADGTMRLARVPYVIDSVAPEVEVAVDLSGRRPRVEVRAREPLREVVLVDADRPSRRRALRASAGRRRFVGVVPWHTDRVRISAVDDARNETVVDQALGAAER
jgi:Ca-activated chloride channel family protein